MKRPLPWLLMACLVILPGCIEPRLGKDARLKPLTVEWLSLDEPGSGEVPLVEVDTELRVRFTERVDPLSLSGDTVLVVAGSAKGPCAGETDCTEGLCVEGECIGEPVDAAFLVDVNRPPLGVTRQARVVQSDVWLTADGTEVRLRPREPLSRPGRYAFVLSAALRDIGGNPLCSADGTNQGLVVEFVTGFPGGTRPQLHLLVPAPGSLGVPTNMAVAKVGATGEVQGVEGDGLWLEGTKGRLPAHVSPSSTGCPEPFVACFELALEGSLEPLGTYGLGQHDRLRDVDGRPMPSSPSDPFLTGTGPDTTPPEVVDLGWEPDGGCLDVRIRTDEVARVRLRWSGESGPEELVLPSFGTEHQGILPIAGVAMELAVDLWDEVGNQSSRPPEALGLSALPSVAISEVLANPAGPEPAEEFVELVNLDTAPVSLEGWFLTDTLAKPGDALPAVSLGPGAVALVVPSTYQGSGTSDPAPAPGTLLLKLQGSTLGYSGLANGGEPVFLLDRESRVVSRYPGGAASGALPANGQSVGRELGSSCEGRGPWKLQPGSSSTPGLVE